MIFTEDDYQELLHASEKLRTATDRMIHLLKSDHLYADTAAREKVWKELEQAREELWRRRTRRTTGKRRRNGH